MGVSLGTTLADAEKHSAQIQRSLENPLYIQHLLENAIKAVNHISENVEEDGYMLAAPDYHWYRFMWFRDSAFTASALAYASSVLSDCDDVESTKAANEAREASLRLLGKLWSVIDMDMPSVKAALRLKLEDPEFKKLKTHIAARFGKDGKLVDKGELENPNSWQKQFDSVPLVLFATAGYIKHFGINSLDGKTLAIIEKDIDHIVEYVIKTYKCVCAGPWEQHPEKLHAYTVAAAYAGLKSAIGIYESLGSGAAKIDRVKDAIYRNDYDGIIYFINKLFVKDSVLHKFRREFANDVEEKPKVDSSAYIVFALFDDGELLGEEIKSATLQELKSNHVFKSIDGKSVYISKMPRRYEGDVYFGGGPWILLGAAEAYYFAKEGNIDEAMAILDGIEKLIPADGFRLPEQEPVDQKSLSTMREGENDAIGNVPAQDLMWSAAEYLRACSLLIEISKKHLTMRELARNGQAQQSNGLEE